LDDVKKIQTKTFSRLVASFAGMIFLFLLANGVIMFFLCMIHELISIRKILFGF